MSKTITNIRVHLELLESTPLVHFRETWSLKPHKNQQLVLGFRPRKCAGQWYCDGQTASEALEYTEGEHFKWGIIQDFLQERFQRDIEAVTLMYQPMVYVTYDDGSEEQLDTTDNWFRFDYHSGYDIALSERLYSLYFETEQFGETLGDIHDEELEEKARKDWSYRDINRDIVYIIEE